ncbi:putative global regulator [Corynebacterium freiburgense]|nr:putative global regulator [Corynebacterium freiburgense]
MSLVAEVCTYKSPFMTRPGAAPASPNIGVAWHYGNPLGEQRGSFLVDRSHHRVLRVSGPDAPTFLNNLLSQQLLDAPTSTAALNLDAQGRILHHVGIWFHNDTFYLEGPAPEIATLKPYLLRMVFWSDVEIKEADFALFTAIGEEPTTGLKRRVQWNGPERWDILIPRDRMDAAVDKLDLPLAGLMAFTAERVKAVEPEVTTDLDAKTIPHEVPAWITSAVHLDKGCYRGQETVARVHNLGRAPRTLVMVHLDGSAPELPEPGAAITAHGRTVGRLGTVVHDCDYGPIALALIKRTALETPDLAVEDVALSIDPDTIPKDEGERPGRVAQNRLRGK